VPIAALAAFVSRPQVGFKSAAFGYFKAQGRACKFPPCEFQFQFLSVQCLLQSNLIFLA